MKQCKNRHHAARVRVVLYILIAPCIDCSFDYGEESATIFSVNNVRACCHTNIGERPSRIRRRCISTPSSGRFSTLDYPTTKRVESASTERFVLGRLSARLFQRRPLRHRHLIHTYRARKNRPRGVCYYMVLRHMRWYSIYCTCGG